MSGVFITGTGTDIGKTFVATALIRHLRAAGKAVHAVKPVVTGFDQENWAASDPALLLEALAYPVTLSDVAAISPWRFEAPLSPDMAAARAGRAIAFAEVVEFCRKTLGSRRGSVLIEGIGGIMVPLAEHRTVLDLISMLRIPVVLVAGSYVGTISHTLTCLEVMARRNLDIAAVAVSESPGSAASLEETLDTLRRFVDPTEVVGIPRLPAGTFEHAAVARLASFL
jgi:dethiobiotin synthetase